MAEPMLIATTLFLAWGWLGFFYAVIWLALSLVREASDKRDRAYIKGAPWDEFPREERERINRLWRTHRWIGLKHYGVGLLLLGVAWLAVVAFLTPEA